MATKRKHAEVTLRKSPKFRRNLKNESALKRSRHPEVFCKKGVLRNFAKFTGKHLCQSLFFNKVAGLRILQNF